MKKILYLESVMFDFLSFLFKGDCGSLLSYRHYYVCHVIRWICQLYSAEPYVKLSGAIHTSHHYVEYQPPPTPCDPDVCHHQCGKIPFGWLTSLIGVCLSISLPLSLSVTLLWRTWWKWLFNHAERSTNQRAWAGWFKGLFRAQLEGERKGGWEEARESYRERDGLGFDCCMPQASSHPLTSGLISLIIVPDRLML